MEYVSMFDFYCMITLLHVINAEYDWMFNLFMIILSIFNLEMQRGQFYLCLLYKKQRVSTYWKLDFKLRLIIECNTYCKLLYSGMCFLSMSICLIDDKNMEEIRSEW